MTAAIIYPATQFNPSSLSADGVYLAIQNPPGFATGVPTDVFGIVGTGSWGPVNAPVHMGNAYDALQAFGPISAAALTDPYDLATDLAIAFGQASSEASLEGFGVRVTDGTDVAAGAALPGAPTSASNTATIGGTAHTGDVCTITFTSSALAGSPIGVVYTVLNTDTLASIAAAFAALINARQVLAAAGIYAIAVGAVVSIYQPTALSPQVTFTQSVTGGGATTTITLSTGAAATGGITLAALYTGIVGNGISAIVAPGAAANTWNVTLSLPVLALSELYPNIPTAGFWAALKTALAQGISGVRGPSSIARGTTTNIAVGAPTAATTALSGGTDGRTSVVTATLLGSDSAVPKTGLYALRGVNPQLGVSWIVGSTDIALPASLVAFGQSEGPEMLFPFPTGTSTAAAIASLQSIGQASPALTYAKDWVYFFDAVNNVTRLVSPLAYMGGRIATLAPQINPGNEQVNLVQGTERNNPTTGTVQPYALSELGQLANAGIMVITNPLPQGSVWGIYSGQSTSLNAVTKGIEWWRTTIFLARSTSATMGKYADMNQSQQPNDPLRNMIKNDLNSLYSTLVGANGEIGVIDSYAVLCAFSGAPNAAPGNGVNTPASIAQGFLFVLIKATYLGTARFIVVALQGGTTVVSVSSSVGQTILG